MIPSAPAIALLLALPGCVFASVTQGTGVPPREQLAAIRPGVTTRADVLALLGPPAELASPIPLARLRAFDPNTTRVLEERELFGRRRWTWDREELEQFRIEGWVFFQYVDTDVVLERVSVTFDEAGVVTDVADTRVMGAGGMR